MNGDPQKFIAQFRKKKILVVGDVMLDEYIEGNVERISPEAPIPVLFQRSVRHVLGGAGNVAANVAALGASVTLVGLVGNDGNARVLTRLCRSGRIVPHLLVDRTRPTTTKRRFVAGHHQLVRMDVEDARPISDVLEARMIKMIRALPRHDMVIISDYAKGCVTKKVVEALRRKFGARSLIADMKPANASFYGGIFAITPNLKEAFDLTGIEASTDALAERATRMLQKRLKTSVILTRGEHGVSVREMGSKKGTHFDSEVLSVKDVTGAGDTMIAAFALMLVSGASFLQAAELANRAAGIVVSIGGTVALTKKKFQEHIART